MATAIYNATGLQNINIDLTGDYELASDIDCSGIANFEPLGEWNGQDPFTGSLDGKGHKITNLVVDRAADDFIGLFGLLDGATVQNLRVESTLTGDDAVGGLAGYIDGGTISNVITVVTIIADDYAGGFAALIYGGAAISDCHSEGSLTEAAAGHTYGGFTGYAGTSATINRCYSTAAVTSTGIYTAGFIGYAAEATITRCYSTGSVAGDHAAGFIGQSGAGAGVTTTTEDCFTLSPVHGVAHGTCFCYGATLAQAASFAIFKNCYAANTLLSDAGAGTEYGFLQDDGAGTVTITKCFWDKTLSNTLNDTGAAVGKTTTELKTLSTIQEAGWAVSRYWNIVKACSGGYPCLIDVNPCCAVSPSPADATIIGDKVTLEAIRNLELVYGGRVYISKSGDFTYESRFHRNV